MRRLPSWVAAPSTSALERLRVVSVEVSPAESEVSRLGRALDFVSDWAVLAFATWTLIAYGGMATRASVSVLVSVWMATFPLSGAALFLLRRRAERPAASSPLAASPRASVRLVGLAPTLLAASLAFGLLAGVLAGTVAASKWPLVWLAALAAVVLALAGLVVRWTGAALVEQGQRQAAHLVAALAGFSFAALSLLVHRPSADDVFYVNRATATAQLGHIPVRDVLVTNEQAPPASGAGLPVETFSALEGALGRFFHVHGASVAYYVAPPIFTFLATWALWRLVRAWVPRAAVICFALACVYWLFSAQDNHTAGSYFLARMWQGKVILVAWLLPTLYVHLTRWLNVRDALTATLLLAGGISSIGLTGSATFIAPLIFSTAALALLARRDWRGLPVVAAAAAFPFLVGFFATRKFPLEEVFASGGVESSFVFTEVFALSVVGAVGMVALCWAPWLAQSRAAAHMTTSIAVIAVVLLAPGVIPVISELSGLTETLRRTLWFIPRPAIVGLLVAVPIGALLRPRVAAFPALLVAACLILFGQPLWQSPSGSSLWRFPPGWKTYRGPLADARAILSRYEGPGPILADKEVMKAIALSTVQPKAVNPRKWYVRLIPEPGKRTAERLRLTRFVMREEPLPTPEQVRRDLADLRVALVCVQSSQQDVVAELRLAGPYTEAFRARGLVCLERRA